MENENILIIKDLDVRLFTDRGELPVIDRLSLTLKAGETLGIVGESGCGKSMLASAIMGLIAHPGKVTGGSIQFEGQELAGMKKKDLRRIRGTGISMIFQEPMTSLNPLMTCGRQIVETITSHEKVSKAEAKERALDMIRSVGIARPEKVFSEVPAQLSGGMRQRIMIAMALICRPRLLICDEPTTALDVTVQAQILGLIRRLQKETGTSVIFISHDMGVISQMADRVAVMYAGQLKGKRSLRSQNIPIPRDCRQPSRVLMKKKTPCSAFRAMCRCSMNCRRAVSSLRAAPTQRSGAEMNARRSWKTAVIWCGAFCMRTIKNRLRVKAREERRHE